MMQRKIDFLFISALILAIWFVLTSSLWVYYLNVVFSLPAGVLSFVLYRIGNKKNPNNFRYKYILYTLILGIILSLVFLAALLLNN